LEQQYNTNEVETGASPLLKAVLWLVFIGSSFLVFNIGGYNSFVPLEIIPFVRLSVVLILLIPTFVLYRAKGGLNKYWRLSFSFLIASIGLFLANFLGRWHNLIPGLSTSTVPGIAVAKLAEILPIVSAILVGMWLIDKDYSPIYLRDGNIRKGLKLGGLASFAALIPFFLMGGLGLTATPMTILSWIPWMSLFAVSNAFMEELMIRGLFLRKFEALLGERQSLLLTSVIFAVFHQAIIGYTDFVSFSVFMGMTFFLGFIWGYVIQKSDNIWGAVLAHTIADIFFVLVVFGV
jgi:membrane protease YdiL (CAAX protease family)